MGQGINLKSERNVPNATFLMNGFYMSFEVLFLLESVHEGKKLRDVTILRNVISVVNDFTQCGDLIKDKTSKDIQNLFIKGKSLGTSQSLGM